MLVCQLNSKIPIFMHFTSTDGNLSLDLANIDYIIGMPDEDTCMLYTKTGKNFEISGNVTNVLTKMNNQLPRSF